MEYGNYQKHFFFFLGFDNLGENQYLRPPMNGEAFALSTSLFFFFSFTTGIPGSLRRESQKAGYGGTTLKSI